jgi:putative DNA primase/helicase
MAADFVWRGVDVDEMPPPPDDDDPGWSDDVGGAINADLGLPEIRIGPDMERVIGEAIEALSEDKRIYQRAGALARIVGGNGAAISIGEIGRTALRAAMAGTARWTQLKRDGGEARVVQALPPLWAVDGVMESAAWPFRRLEGIVYAPTMRPDGTLISSPGYDASTGLFLAPGLGLKVSIPAKPTREDGQRAWAMLDDLLSGFLFEAPCHRSAAMAAIITAACRASILGPIPMFLISASTPGTGKSLLADVISWIAFGSPAPKMAVCEDDEMRKRITTLAMTGSRIVALDNIVGSLGGAALDAALTCTEWQDRVLGSNRTVTLPLSLIWLATGNNVMLIGDLLRRVVPITLMADRERPEERSGFKHPDLLRYIAENRSELLAAALTIPIAYAVAGRPRQPVLPYGSFSAWSDSVRAALVWVGEADPCQGREKLRLDADPWVTHAGAVLAEVYRAKRDEPFMLRQLVELSQGCDELREALAQVAGKDGFPTLERVGKMARKLRGRIIGGLSLEKADSGRITRWQVVKHPPPPEHP